MNINHGPFKGVSPTSDELRLLYNEHSEPVLRDGQHAQVFALHARTQRFLDVFPPAEGWSVEIAMETGPFDLPDPYTREADGSMVRNPTMLFHARLRNVGGTIVNTAMFLKVINSVSSVQEGESAVRGRLYDALGLPGSIQGEVTDVVRPPQPQRTPLPIVALGNQVIEEAPRDDSQAQPDAATPSAQNGAVTSPEPAPQAQPVPVAVAVATPAAAAVPAAAPQVPAPSSVTVEGISVTAKNGDVLNSNLVRQAVNRAKIRGIQLPTQFDSKEHLRAIYTDLTRPQAA